MEVIVFVGLQGAGKSTFYRTSYAATHVLVSKDLFRNNRRPQRRQMHLIEQGLREGRSVVVDNTNPTPEDRAPVIALAKAYGAEAVGVWFDVAIDDCLERNALRTGRERVPDRVLFITARRLQPPIPAEGFDRVVRVRVAANGGFAVDEVQGTGEP